MNLTNLPPNVLEKVKDIVFNYAQCSMKELSNLCLVSKTIHNDVVPYIYCNHKICFTLTCKCSRQLQRSDVVYLCKPFCDKKGFSFDWRCKQCTLLSDNNKRGKGFGKGCKKIHSYGVIDVHDTLFRTCNAVIKKGNQQFKFCRTFNCNHNV